MNNVWEAAASFVEFSVANDAAVKVVFSPTGGDEHVYLNGFELDGPSPKAQIAFPFPESHNMHLEPEQSGSLQASWRAPNGTSDVKYDVYLGTSADKLANVGKGLAKAFVTFTGKRHPLRAGFISTNHIIKSSMPPKPIIGELMLLPLIKPTLVIRGLSNLRN